LPPDHCRLVPRERSSDPSYIASKCSRTPVDAIADVVDDAVAEKELAPTDPVAAAAVIMGVILQTAAFHIYGRLSGSLSARARPWRARP
jgi:hypothetical protein